MIPSKNPEEILARIRTILIDPWPPADHIANRLFVPGRPYGEVQPLVNALQGIVEEEFPYLWQNMLRLEIEARRLVTEDFSDGHSEQEHRSRLLAAIQALKSGFRRGQPGGG